MTAWQLRPTSESVIIFFLYCIIGGAVWLTWMITWSIVSGFILGLAVSSFRCSFIFPGAVFYRAGWFIVWSLLELTGAYWSLLGLTGAYCLAYCLGLAGAYWSLLELTGAYWSFWSLLEITVWSFAGAYWRCFISTAALCVDVP